MTVLDIRNFPKFADYCLSKYTPYVTWEICIKYEGFDVIRVRDHHYEFQDVDATWFILKWSS
jgi:hypothetical protein